MMLLNEVKNEIPSITNLATTTTALNAELSQVKNKKPSFHNKMYEQVDGVNWGGSLG